MDAIYGPMLLLKPTEPNVSIYIIHWMVRVQGCHIPRRARSRQPLFTSGPRWRNSVGEIQARPTAEVCRGAFYGFEACRQTAGLERPVTTEGCGLSAWLKRPRRVLGGGSCRGAC